MRPVVAVVVTVIEGLLWLAVVADMLLLTVGVVFRPQTYEPYGAPSLIVLIVALAIVRHFAGREDY